MDAPGMGMDAFLRTMAPVVNGMPTERNATIAGIFRSRLDSPFRCARLLQFWPASFLVW